MATNRVRVSAHFLLDEYEEARREASARLRARRSRVDAITEGQWRRYTDPSNPEASGRWEEPRRG